MVMPMSRPEINNRLTCFRGLWEVAAASAQARNWDPQLGRRTVVTTTPTLAPVLAHDYGLETNVFRRHAGGFESDCLVADGRWFVKIWRGSEAPVRLGLLGELHAVGLPVPVPIPTKAGELHAWWGGRPYAVFDFVEGGTAQDDDWRLTAQALKRVHELDGVDLPRGSMDEPDIWRLRERLHHPLSR